MTRNFIPTIAFVVLLLSYQGFAFCQSLPELDHRAQGYIDSVVSGAIDEYVARGVPSELRESPALESLRVMSMDSLEDFISQTILYQIPIGKNDLQRERRRQFVHGIRIRYCEEAAAEDVVAAAVSLLNIDDFEFHVLVTSLLHVELAKDWDFTFSLLAEFAISFSDLEAFDVVKYMFEKHPHGTIPFLVRASGVNASTYSRMTGVSERNQAQEALGRLGLLKPEQSSEIIANLLTLKDDEHWWVRYYVATRLVKYRELRDPILIDSLLIDSNENIKSLVESIPPYERYRRVGPPPAPGSPELWAEHLERLRYLEEQGVFEEMYKKTAEGSRPNK